MPGREKGLRDASSTFHSEGQERPVHGQIICGVGVSRGTGEARDNSEDEPSFQRGSSAF